VASEKVVLYGFQRSTYVNVARLALLAKGVQFQFHDTEAEMFGAEHLARHPFGRVPVLRHGDFLVYETLAIAEYVEEAFEGPRLMPAQATERALTRQWISNLSSYFYPYIIYHLVHERLVFSELGIEQDENVVAAALPKIAIALDAMELQLHADTYLTGRTPTLADYFMLPTITALSFVAEGESLLRAHPRINGWLSRMGALPCVLTMRASLPQRLPIEHARQWVTDHRPAVRSGAGS